ncbi:MAG: molybdopterin molybdotransferase MoeA [Promicromonosporaceae bacterium]|nr:molybdopterin molybdotransferase MoeA [Promicromonosporaceae bacterium]
MQPLRSVAEHVAAVLARTAPLPAVRVALAEAAVEAPGLVLAADVAAATPVPPFDHSAVDGYATVLPPAWGQEVRVVGGVAAGGAPAGAVAPGEAVRVMTGAPVPAGADVVVPVELSSTGRFVPGQDDGATTVTLLDPRKRNIRRRGEDVAAGDVLARAGSLVTPALVAAAAAAGVADLAVHRRPRVAVISTGSELAPAGTVLGPSGIVDSNSLMVAAIVRAAGGEPLRRGGVPDDAATLRAALDALAEDADLIVTTGGVSAGAWDVVRQVLTEPDARLSDADLTAVAMRPGRPQALARWRGVPWVALPGTPTAAFVGTHLFVRPAIAALRGQPRETLTLDLNPTLTFGSTLNVVGPPDSGHEGSRPESQGPTTGSGGRVHVVPVTRDGRVVPGGNHSLRALVAADGLALLPPGVRDGDAVPVVRCGGAA